MALDPWLVLRKKYLGDVTPASIQGRTLSKKEARYKLTGKVETWSLCLPSSLEEKVQDSLGMAVDQEVKLREALAFQCIRIVVLVARELLGLGYDKRQPKTTGAQTKSRNRISRCKFRRDVGISTYNDHRQALIQLRALDRTKLANRGEMTVADTYIARSVDQPRGVGSSKAKDGRAYLWERGFATTGMAYGYSERAGSKRSHDDAGISFFSRNVRLHV
jgi:hypothetical protein